MSRRPHNLDNEDVQRRLKAAEERKGQRVAGALKKVLATEEGREVFHHLIGKAKGDEEAGMWSAHPAELGRRAALYDFGVSLENTVRDVSPQLHLAMVTEAHQRAIADERDHNRAAREEP